MMNERIKELAEQAGLISKQDDRENWQEYINDVEKFAELIIQECMRMCDCADISLLEHNCPKEASGAVSAKEIIKEHFGIEE
jgi:hypothetical protein